MRTARPAGAARDVPSFTAPYAPADELLAAPLVAAASRPPEAESRIDARATRLIEAIRAGTGRIGGVEDFLHAYALSTKEGLALMVLAEALLRVPDSATADRLIEDKLKVGDWTGHDAKSASLLVSASAWTLGITARIIHPGETPEGIVDALVKRLGLPAVRTATRQAMRLLGSHFVLGQTIDEALARAGAHREFLYSFDMLGEGARTAADAERYFEAYANAIAAIGKSAGNAALPGRPGISVKLSALHPRYEPLSRERVLAELTPKLIELARLAKRHELNLTVDAEEADRLELSLAVIGAALRDTSLAGWDGFGLAVQAYQKRSAAVIDWIAEARERARSPADGAAGQRRLLGHRGQARAGTRPCRLSGVHAQGDDRPLLSRLRAQIAGGAAPALSAIRHAQRAHRGERDRGRRQHRWLRVPAPARHGRGALSRADRRTAAAYLPRLCAGRRLFRTACLSGAPAPGERRQFLVRVGRRRSFRAHRRYLETPASLDFRCKTRAPFAYSAAARPVRATQEFDGCRIRRPRGARRVAGRDPRCAARRARIALGRRHRRCWPQARRVLAHRWRGRRHGAGGRRGNRCIGHGCGAGRICRMERDAA